MTQLATRKAARRRTQPRRWWDWRSFRPYTVLGLVLLVLIAGLGYVAYNTSVLGVRSVVVAGTDRLTVEAVESAAAIDEGEPLVRLDAGAIRDRVAALPQVLSVSVDRRWPSTVRIEVTERTEIAYTERDGASWLVDEHGVLIAAAADVPSGFPQLDVDEVGPDNDTALAALQVIGALPIELQGKVSRVSATSPDDVTLSLADGRTVVWGSVGDDDEAKAQALPGLLKQQGGTYDVSGIPNVVVR